MSKHPNQYHSTSRVATAISQSSREQRMKEQWQVEPKDELARKAVFDHMAQLGLNAKMEIFHYDGKPISGIEAPYVVVEYLKDRAGIPEDFFEAYRRKSKTIPYTKWLKDKKPVGSVFGKRFHGMHPTTVLKKTS